MLVKVKELKAYGPETAEAWEAFFNKYILFDDDKIQLALILKEMGIENAIWALKFFPYDRRFELWRLECARVLYRCDGEWDFICRQLFEEENPAMGAENLYREVIERSGYEELQNFFIELFCKG